MTTTATTATKHFLNKNKTYLGVGAVVVAQLVERSLPIPEVRGLNPVIGKKFIYILSICLLSTVYRKDENKEKRGREWPIKKLIWVSDIVEWIRLRLPSCGPGFKYRAHHLCFLHILSNYLLSS